MFLGQIQGLFMTMRLWDILDILVVAFFLYRIYILIRDTRATALLKGLVFLGIFTVIAGWLQLHVVSWILDKLMTVLIVALPVVFQPELRRALEQIGRGKFYVSSRVMNEVEWDHVIDDVVAATMTNAKVLGVEPERLFVVSVMPCTAKKAECALPSMVGEGGAPDVDVALTVREMVRMIRASHVSVDTLTEEPLDTPLGFGTGAGVIFGATGGVMEAAVRSA